MFCPNCGCKNNKHQNFCRYCGLSLDETARSLKNQLAFGEKAYRLRNFDRLRRWLATTSGILMTVFAVGLLAVVLFDRESTAFFVKIALSTVIGFDVIYRTAGFIERRKMNGLDANRFAEGGRKDTELPAAETVRLLGETGFAPAAAVATEEKTRRLFAENKTRKIE